MRSTLLILQVYFHLMITHCACAKMKNDNTMLPCSRSQGLVHACVASPLLHYPLAGDGSTKCLEQGCTWFQQPKLLCQRYKTPLYS